jgi:hypothetical protein
MLGHKTMEMFGLKSKVSIKSLEAKAEAVFNVLNAHKVFGNLEGLRFEVERRGFKSAVTDHATGDDNHNYLELTYPSCVRLIIHTNIFAGEADFREITAYDHPRENPRMNYEALNEDIKTALREFSAW